MKILLGNERSTQIMEDCGQRKVCFLCKRLPYYKRQKKQSGQRKFVKVDKWHFCRAN